MKKIAILLALVIVLGAGISAVTYMKNEVPVTYNAQAVGTDACELLENYEQYEADVHPDAKA